MRYVYLTAYRIIGATKPDDAQEVTLGVFPELNGKALLAYEIDDLLFEVDRSNVIKGMILRAAFAESQQGSVDERIAAEIESIRRHREGTKNEGVYIVYKGQGEIESWSPRVTRELENFAIAFEATDKAEIRKHHQRPVRGALAAFALASDHISQTEIIADEVYFLDESDKPTYSFDIGVSGSGTVSTTLKPESVEYVQSNLKLLSKHDELVDAARLLTRTLNEKSDTLFAFLSAWSGLEIFVNKAFKRYEAEMFQDERVANIPETIIGRIRSVMSDKYRVVDRFALVAHALASPEEESDLREFKRIKDVRDRLMHGSDVPLASLPLADTEKLLRRYMELHVRHIDPENH